MQHQASFIHRVWVLSLLILNCLCFAPRAIADRPPIAISRDAKVRIPDLKFGWPKFVKADPDLGKQVAKYYVLITGAYSRKNWDLYMNGSKLRLDKNRRFDSRVPILAKNTEIKFVAKGPRGELVKESLSIFVIDWDGTFQTSLYGRPKFELIPSLGVSYLAYQQTNHRDFTELSLGAKLHSRFVYSPPNWSALATVAGTIFAFAGSTAEANIHLLNIDVVTGYTFYFGNSGFSVDVMPGFHYKTTFVTGDSFGYFGIAGPQLRTNANYQFKSGDQIGLYLKLGPLVRGGRLLSFKNFEFAQGLGPVFLLKSGHVMPVMVETSFLTLDLDGNTVNAFTALLTVGYSL